MANVVNIIVLSSRYIFFLHHSFSIPSKIPELGPVEYGIWLNLLKPSGKYMSHLL
jgi:hypothetical protein